MTTIAYKDGVLAADSQHTDCCSIFHYADKIQRWGHCVLVGAGESFELSKLFDWMAKVEDFRGERLPGFLDPETDFSALIFRQDGEIWEVSSAGIFDHTDSAQIVMGSGRAFAHGAMLAGASSERAVEIAICCDIYSGGDVNTLNVGVYLQW